MKSVRTPIAYSISRGLSFPDYLRPSLRNLLFQWKEGIRRGLRKEETDSALVVITLKRILQVGTQT